MINSGVLGILVTLFRGCINTMQNCIIVDLFGYQLNLLTFLISFSLFMGIISVTRGSRNE